MECFDMGENAPEECVRVDSSLRIQVVMSSPVRKLGTMDGNQGGDGVTSQAEQVSEQVLAVALTTGGCGCCLRPEFCPESLPLL